MKTSFLASTSLLLISLQLSAKELPVKSKIDNVTVYSTSAEINRKGSVYIPEGKHIIKFTNLTPHFQENSLQVTGSGTYTILSVTKKNNYFDPKKSSTRYQVIQDSLELLRNEVSLSTQMRTVYNQEKEMILANKIVIRDKNGSSPADVEVMANFYRKRLMEILQLNIKAQQKEKKINLEIQRLQQELNQVSRQNKNTGEVHVEIQCNAPVTSKMKLSYIVRNARWAPQYNVRVNSSSEEVNIARNALISQNTGVDWNNVKVTLSTANPIVSTTIPVLSPWRLGFVQGRRGKVAYSAYSNRATIMAEADEAEDAVSAGSSARFTSVVESAVDLRFKVGIRSDIPSDGLHHNVNVQNLKTDAEFVYTTVPKRQQETFLLCNIKDWEKHQLLSGPANVYLNGSYVGKSHINARKTGEKIGISMGIDKQVVVTRRRLEDFCDTKFLGSNKRETIAIQVVVKNNKQRSIKVNVKEQIPVAGNGEIEVELLEKSEAKVNDKTGMLDWELELTPGESKALIFKYEVKYPKDKMINL